MSSKLSSHMPPKCVALFYKYYEHKSLDFSYNEYNPSTKTFSKDFFTAKEYIIIFTPTKIYLKGGVGPDKRSNDVIVYNINTNEYIIKHMKTIDLMLIANITKVLAINIGFHKKRKKRPYDASLILLQKKQTIQKFYTNRLAKLKSLICDLMPNIDNPVIISWVNMLYMNYYAYIHTCVGKEMISYRTQFNEYIRRNNNNITINDNDISSLATQFIIDNGGYNSMQRLTLDFSNYHVACENLKNDTVFPFVVEMNDDYIFIIDYYKNLYFITENLPKSFYTECDSSFNFFCAFMKTEDYVLYKLNC